MKEILTVLCLVLAVSAGTISAQTPARHFDNPVIEANWPDPTVFRDAETGLYYCFATEGSARKTYYSSPDLVHWEKTPIFPTEDDAVTQMSTYGPHHWAPAYAYVGGRHMMYISVVNPGKRGNLTSVVALSSDKARGPYRFESFVTRSVDSGIKDSIDPFVIEDEGKVWMLFGSTGGMFIVRLTEDGTALYPGARFLHVAGVDYNRDNFRERCFEGGYLYKKSGWWYLFGSAGRYADSSYKLIVGRSRNICGPYTDKSGRPMSQGWGTPILTTDSSNDLFYGPGHNGEIFTDATGQDYMFYHAHLRPFPGKDGSRVCCLQRLFWDDEGWPYFETGHPVWKETVPQL